RRRRMVGEPDEPLQPEYATQRRGPVPESREASAVELPLAQRDRVGKGADGGRRVPFEQPRDGMRDGATFRRLGQPAAGVPLQDGEPGRRLRRVAELLTEVPLAARTDDVLEPHARVAHLGGVEPEDFARASRLEPNPNGFRAGWQREGPGRS